MDKLWVTDGKIKVPGTRHRGGKEKNDTGKKVQK
jgi:hypothetical protein